MPNHTKPADDTAALAAAAAERSPVEDAAHALLEAQRVEAIMAKPLFNNAEIAELLHLPLSTFFAIKSALKIPCFKIGRKSLTRREDFLRWIDAQAAAAQKDSTR